MPPDDLQILLIENPNSHHIRDLIAFADLDRSAVTAAGSIDDATRILEAQDFDILLVDLALPDAHGLGTVTRIRDAAPDIPMIVFTDELDEPMALQAVQVGAQDYLVKARDGAAELQRSLRFSLSAKGAEESLAYLAQHDHLTGLVNRGLFEDRLDHAILRCLRHDSLLALLVIDLDDFAAVNEAHGPEVGDELLKAVAEGMREPLRRMDTLARSHSNTFLLVAEDVVSPSGAEVVAGKILDALAAPFQVGGNPVKVSASIGICLFPLHASNSDELLRAAESAMESAKKAGGNGFRFSRER